MRLVTADLIQLFFYPANPLGILIANVLSPALVKKAEDIPMMVRALRMIILHVACVLRELEHIYIDLCTQHLRSLFPGAVYTHICWYDVRTWMC